MPLKEKLAQKIPELRDEIKSLVKEHGDKVISESTVRQAYGGMRGIKCMVWETSLLDPLEGIRFRGYTIPELQKKLPKVRGGEEPLPEGIFWLLLTGELPTKKDVKEITKEWQSRGEIPQNTWKTLKALPTDMHPMTQFAIGILSLQPTSEYVKKYNQGIPKTEYWDPMYEDVMNLLAKLPAIAAYIYRRTYKDGKRIRPIKRLDWGANFAHM
ncbi:MAG: type I citrate synthase, partial [candidate division Zixibacteria bacterium SM23_73_3]